MKEKIFLLIKYLNSCWKLCRRLSFSLCCFFPLDYMANKFFRECLSFGQINSFLLRCLYADFALNQLAEKVFLCIHCGFCVHVCWCANVFLNFCFLSANTFRLSLLHPEKLCASCSLLNSFTGKKRKREKLDKFSILCSPSQRGKKKKLINILLFAKSFKVKTNLSLR